MKPNSLQELYIEQLQDLYDAVWSETHSRSARRQSNVRQSKLDVGVLECRQSVVHSAE